MYADHSYRSGMATALRPSSSHRVDRLSWPCCVSSDSGEETTVEDGWHAAERDAMPKLGYSVGSPRCSEAMLLYGDRKTLQRRENDFWGKNVCCSHG
jgi:hypothetical protein